MTTTSIHSRDRSLSPSQRQLSPSEVVIGRKPLQLRQPLDRDELDKLAVLLHDRVRDLEDLYEPFYNDVRIWWSWYEAEPRTARKDTPWQDASNIVLPLIQSQADSLTARNFALLNASPNQTWMLSSQNEDLMQEFGDDIQRFMNWTANREYDLFYSIYDWQLERNVIGGSVLGLRWAYEERKMMLPGSNRIQNVTIHRGPVIEHIPAEMIMWTPGCPVRTAPEVYQRSFLTWTDLVQKTQQSEDGWNQDAVERTKHHIFQQGDEAADVYADKERRSGVKYDLSNRKIYDVRKAWIDWPVARGSGILESRLQAFDPDSAATDDLLVPLLVTFCPDSKEVFDVRPTPYPTLPGNPYYETFFRRRSGYPRGVGLSRKLNHLQRGMTTMANQGIDAVTLSNAFNLVTSSRSLANKRPRPNQVLHIDDINAIKELKVGGSLIPEQSMVNLLNVFAERLGGQSDALLGRESRSGGHPSPATNFLGMVQQGEQLNSPAQAFDGRAFGDLGLDTASLYQLFDTDQTGRLRRVFGELDGSKIEEWMFPISSPLAGSFSFSLRPLSRTSNPDQELQKTVIVTQLTQNFLANSVQAIQLVQNPDPNVQALGRVAIELLNKMHLRALRITEIDDAQELMRQLTEEGLGQDDQQGLIDQFGEQFGSIAQSAVPPTGVPTPPGGNGNGAQSIVP